MSGQCLGICTMPVDSWKTTAPLQCIEIFPMTRKDWNLLWRLRITFVCMHSMDALCNFVTHYRKVFRSHYSMEQGRNLLRTDLQRSGWPEKDRSLAEHEKTWGPGCCHVCVWVCQRPLGGGWHNHWGSGATSQHSTLWLSLTFEESLLMDLYLINKAQIQEKSLSKDNEAPHWAHTGFKRHLSTSNPKTDICWEASCRS